MKSLFTGIVMVTLLVLAGTTAMAAPITFAAADYDNSAVQTFGVFRDVFTGADINRGQNLEGLPGDATPADGLYTALNFWGSDTNAAYQGATTLYDTNVTDGIPTLFSGDISLSADILIDPFNNAKGAGLVFLFNEGVGKEGLALYLWNAGNTDSYAINFVHQDGVSTPGTNAASQVLNVPSNGQIPEDQWFRLSLNLAFTSATAFTATGSVFRHSDPTNPNSVLGTQVGTNLVYNSALSSVLLNPYEVGLVGRAVQGLEGTSVTNFSIDSPASITAVPEPGSMLLLGTGLIGMARAVRRRIKK